MLRVGGLKISEKKNKMLLQFEIENTRENWEDVDDPRKRREIIRMMRDLATVIERGNIETIAQ